MKNHKHGFTLAEVLITLVIIGIIAAMTIPSIIQNTNKQEYYVKLKKNYSSILNALKLAQANEGAIGDNTALFTPSESSTASYDTAVKMAKYLNAVKVCQSNKDTGCSDAYYAVDYAVDRDDPFTITHPAIILADGSIYKILQYPNCYSVATGYVTDETGQYIYDDEGNKQDFEYNRSHCALLYIDINGAKKPNKFGEDNFLLTIYTDTIQFASSAHLGGNTVVKKILMNTK